MLARQIAIGCGIAIIFPLLVYYGVATFYPRPQPVNNATAVLELPGPPASADERKEYADRQIKALRDYEAAAKAFSRIHILVAAPVGIAAILVGAFLSIHPIGTGLIFGGMASVAWGYYGYWQYLDDWARFISLLAAFAILLFVGYRRIAPLAPAPLAGQGPTERRAKRERGGEAADGP